MKMTITIRTTIDKGIGWPTHKDNSLVVDKLDDAQHEELQSYLAAHAEQWLKTHKEGEHQ
jgi:hypothetical protein